MRPKEKSVDCSSTPFKDLVDSVDIRSYTSHRADETITPCPENTGMDLCLLLNDIRI